MKNVQLCLSFFLLLLFHNFGVCLARFLDTVYIVPFSLIYDMLDMTCFSHNYDYDYDYGFDIKNQSFRGDFRHFLVGENKD